jgi:hypothetical protein
LIGTANPTPSAFPDSLRICALIPMTVPRASKSGPPEFPLLIGASVWMASTRLYCDVSDLIERSVAATTPTESELTFPNGLPIAATGSPTTTPLESPSGTGATRRRAGSLSRVTGRRRSRPPS